MRYINIDHVESTNSYAKLLDDISVDELTVIRAERQTGGRGRGANSFFSDHIGGLWVSIISPINDISAHFRYNRAISLAILESLKDICADINKNTGDGIKIKWPNDICWNGRKTAGILLENIIDKPEFIIIGFGININMRKNDFPRSIRETSTSVLMETGLEISIEKLLDNILKKYECRINDENDNAAHRLYVTHLYNKGLSATVDNRSGIFITVDPDGRLRLETDNGYELFSSGTLRFTDNNNISRSDKNE